MNTEQHPDSNLESTLRRVSGHLSTRGGEYLERPAAVDVDAASGGRAGARRLSVVLGAAASMALVGAAVLALGGGGSAGRLEPQTSTGGSEATSPLVDDSTPSSGADGTTAGGGSDGTVQAIGITTLPGDSLPEGPAPDDTRLEPPVITVLPPPTVTTPGDLTSPLISEVDVPSVVTAGQTFSVRWRAADPDEVSSTGVTIGWASGIYTACGVGTPGRLESGTTLDGTWLFVCAMPANAVSTEYSVKVQAQDSLGNWSESGWFYFTVVGGSSDASPPAYSNIRIVSGAQVGAVLTVTWTLVDASGIDNSVMWVAGPTGGFTDPAGNRYALYETMVVTSDCVGDTCTFTQTVQLSPTAPAGSYSLWVSATDTLGNKVLEQALSFTVIP